MATIITFKRHYLKSENILPLVYCSAIYIVYAVAGQN
jgi:hypothetical protein